MQTAMKLPPHILPTLDELDGRNNPQDKSVGVYVPGIIDKPVLKPMLNPLLKVILKPRF
jgi:hypothetical protein